MENEKVCKKDLQNLNYKLNSKIKQLEDKLDTMVTLMDQTFITFTNVLKDVQSNQKKIDDRLVHIEKDIQVIKMRKHGDGDFKKENYPQLMNQYMRQDENETLRITQNADSKVEEREVHQELQTAQITEENENYRVTDSQNKRYMLLQKKQENQDGSKQSHEMESNSIQMMRRVESDSKIMNMGMQSSSTTSTNSMTTPHGNSVSISRSTSVSSLSMYQQKLTNEPKRQEVALPSQIVPIQQRRNIQTKIQEVGYPTYRELKVEMFEITDDFVIKCLEMNCMAGDIKLFRKMYVDDISKELIPIRHVRKSYQYWFDGRMVDDDSTGGYIKNTIIKNIESLYMKVNTYERYENNLDKFIQNQDYICKLKDEKNKNIFLKNIIPFVSI
jgi:hypothetical protein